ncbi:MAG: PQQ-binding-like beta-propeller repeat protein [Pirellulaceae bacterium]
MKQPALLFLATLCLPAVLTADDWANWRGPAQNGLSRETNLVNDWTLDGKNILWMDETGGRATPIILNDRIYLDCRTPDDFNDPVEKIHAREQVICWDAKTGKVLWNDKFNVFQTDIPAPRVGWASMGGDPETGYVYAHTVAGLLICYDADGNRMWEHSMVEEYGEILGYGGRIQTPIIDEDRLIISFLAANWGDTKGPAPLHYYYAFDKKSGELLWVTAPGEAPEGTNYSMPIVAELGGQRVLVGGNGDGGIYAINARTGTKLWGFKMSAAAINATPVVMGDMVFTSHGADNIDGDEFGSVRCFDGNKAITDPENAVVWRKDGIKADYASLIVHDGVVYVMTDVGELYALDAKTGDEYWRQNCGTVGKGSPVWADGKIYLTEVNGNVWILKPSREKCEVLSHVHLPAIKGTGDDEIYASVAVSNGRVVVVSRDRTICLSNGEQPGVAEIETPVLDEEPAADGAKIASIQLRPYEMILPAGESVEYEVHCFDDHGRFIKKMPATLSADPGLQDLKIDGATVTAPKLDRDIAGNLSVSVGDLTAKARVRVFNGNRDWAWDFEGLKGVAVPPTWVRAHIKTKPTSVDGNTVMLLGGIGNSKGRPGHTVFIGSPDMKDYTIQADVRMQKRGRQLPNIGITANRYTFMIKGNYRKVQMQSWQPHLRMAADASFNAEADTWYTMKFKVKVVDGEANLFGKIWKTGEAEPDAWTLETTDPHANESGSPGLYVYATTDCMFDNVKVMFDE